MSNSATCAVEMHGDKVCGRPVCGSSSKCVFHAKKNVTNTRTFAAELKQYIDTQPECYDFTGFVFPDDQTWKLPVEYDRETHFNGCVFEGIVILVRAQFRESVSFVDAVFRKELNISFAEFYKKVDFTKATFEDQAGFFKVCFLGSTGARFSGANFKGQAIFVSSLFRGSASFVSAHFQERADYRDVAFGDNANFGHSEFLGEVADFEGARFLRNASFFQTEFDSSVSFRNGLFHDIVRFNGAQFCRAVDFRGRTFPNTAIVNFEAATFEEPRKVWFDNNDLSHVSFAECEINHINFLRVSWLTTGRLWWFRKLLQIDRRKVYDEILIKNPLERSNLEGIFFGKDPRDFQLAARQYRMLEDSYSTSYRYREAGDFWVGEQEMLRQNRKYSLYGLTSFLYKFASFYGESFVLPAVWIGIVLLVAPILLMLCGVNIGSDQPHNQLLTYVNYDLGLKIPDLSELVSDYFRTVTENLLLVTPGRSNWREFLPSYASVWIVIAETIMLAAMLPLFLLALRRKFRRKSF